MSKINIITVVVVLAVLGLSFLVLNSKAVANNLSGLKLIPQSENFTELYLLNHQTIPYTITPNKEVSFEFVIHNLENKNINYPYEVFIIIDGKKQPLVKNSILIKQNESKTIKQSLSANFPSRKFEIVINLINKNQSVDFWVKE